ncbi:DUF6801 domain-containing protein [Saccharothrix lopnurensis]|uniref:DUF6801 domain-containing protein n=1 Tax=Saccharothrix lopnurensis TaxID=1670621 RepID=A0ABW1P199_9PSEU
MGSRLRVAALGLCAAVVGGSALLGAGVGSAATATLTLVYSCPFPLIGDQDMSVRIVAEDLPGPDEAVAGQPLPPVRVTATATVPPLATQGLVLVGAATVEGTARATTVVDNAGTPLEVVPELGIARTDVPPEGPFDTVAIGEAPSVTLPHEGDTTIRVGAFEATLTPKTATGEDTGLGTFPLPCTLKPDQDTLLHRFTVRPGGGTTTTTTTTTTDETTTTTTTSGTGTTTTTDPTTTTTGSTTTGTTTSGTDSTTTTATTTTTTAPPAAPGGGSGLASTGASVRGLLVAGGALLLVGAGTVFHLRRRRT